MSFGSLFGAMWNTVAFAVIWVILGKVVEVVTRAFNISITVLPSFQDAVNGMNIMQTAWTGIMVLIFIGVWVNYVINEHQATNQVV